MGSFLLKSKLESLHSCSTAKDDGVQGVGTLSATCDFADTKGEDNRITGFLMILVHTERLGRYFFWEVRTILKQRIIEVI
jgi:hypothetical protein